MVRKHGAAGSATIHLSPISFRPSKNTNSAIAMEFLTSINILGVPEGSPKKNKWCEVSPDFPRYKMLWCSKNTHPKRTNGAKYPRNFPY